MQSYDGELNKYFKTGLYKAVKDTGTSHTFYSRKSIVFIQWIMCQFLYRPLGTLNTKERKKIAYNTQLVWPTEIVYKFKNYNMK